MSLDEYEQRIGRLTADVPREIALHFGAKTLRRHFHGIGRYCGWQPDEVQTALAIAPNLSEEMIESLIGICRLSEDPEAPERGIPAEAMEFLLSLKEFLLYWEDGKVQHLREVSYRALAFIDGIAETTEDESWSQDSAVAAEIEKQASDLNA